MLRILRAVALPLLATATLALSSVSFSFAQFTQGNLVVVQPQGSTSVGQAVNLLEINPTGALVNTYTVIPSSGANQLTVSGSATSEGFWSLSAEKDQIIAVGYDAALGTAGVASGAANRVIGSVNYLGAYTRQYSQAIFSGNNIRGGTSYGTNYYAVGANTGVVLMNTGTILSSTSTNNRCMQIVNGNMYFSSGSGSYKGVNIVGSGISNATGQVAVAQQTDIASASGNTYGFALSPDGNTLYVASSTASYGILKYTRTGGTGLFIAASYTVYGTACSGIAVDFSTANPTIYATLSTGLSLIKLVDAGSTVVSPTILYTTAASTPFRGVMFAPAEYGSVSGNTAICSGNSATVSFTGNPYGTITYNINGGANQTIVLDSAQGAATVNTGTLTANATYNLVSITTPGGTKPLTGSVTVTVNPLPAAIGGASTVCTGTATTLTDATAPGTWASNTTSVATIGSASGVLNAAGTGTSTITYTLPTGCYITRVVTVIASPAAIGGTQSVCQGNTTTLTDATSGGTWQSDATAVASVGSSSGIVSGVAANTANITYTAPNGCIAQAVVTVNPLAAITGAGPVCVNAVITLSNTNTGGTWTSSNTAAGTVNASSGVVTGIASGTTTISYSLSTGCTATAVITVNPLPSAISGTLEFCANATTALSDAGGGTWSSGTTSVATVGTSSGTVVAVAAGTAVITYTLPTGCIATAVVTVDPLPAAIGGPSTVCIGSSITLTNTSAGGTWSSLSANAHVVDASAGIISGAIVGSGTIKYTLGTGCYIMKTVTVNDVPAAISGTATVCEGGSTTLSDVSMGGSWISDAASIASVGSGSGIVSGIVAGTANISYVLTTGCYAATVATVGAAPGAIAGTMVLCQGATTTLSNSVGGGTWTKTGANISVGGTTGIVSGISAGTAVVTYTLGSGCATTAVVTVNALPNAIGAPATICVGATATLTESATGGTWSSSNTSAATIGSSSGVVTGAAIGTSVISYTLSTGCYATTAITVNGSPAAISGTLTVCPGTSATLSNTVTGGTWTEANGNATVGTLSGIVTGATAGTDVVTYALGSGCYTTAVVTINALPGAISGASALCVGATQTLGSTPGGGTWVSSNTAKATIDGTTGVVTGVAGGTTVISYTLNTGCYVTRVETVNVLPAAIGGAGTVCVGSNITLSNTATGGTWTEANGNATVGTLSGIVTGATAGTDVVTYALGSGCYTTAVVTVNALPGAISGASALCVGATQTLGSTPGGGTWASSNTAKATIDGTTGVVTGVAGGTAVISYTLNTGCYVTRVETVNAVPAAIGGASAVCVGSNVTLSDATPSGTWTSTDAPATITIDGTTGIVTGVAAGVANITYALGTGCSVTAPVTVNALPAAISGTGAVCVGNTLTLTDATTGGTWVAGSAVAAIDAATGIVTGNSAGTVAISYISAQGCVQSAIVTVNALPAAISGTSALCTGTSVLWSNSSAGGTWMSNDASVASVGISSGIVSAIAPGTTTITYTLPTGCMITKAITVNGAPAAITGAAAICGGTTLTLSDATTGGTWSSASASVATVGSASGVVTGISSGTAVITYTASTGCSTSAIVTVSATPSAITGTASACVGAVASLFNTVMGGTWTSSNTSVATVGASTGTVTGVTAGIATISYALSSGCVATTTFTVNQLPAPITGTTILCGGASSTLADAIAGGSWTSSNTAIVTVGTASGVLAGITSGTAYVTYTLPTGCRIFTAVTVSVTPPAIAGPAAICTGTTGTLSDAIGGGVWSSSDTSVATIASASGIVSGLGSGTASITYNYSGCTTAMTLTVNLSPSGIAGGTLVCLGAPLSLSNAVAGGTWSSGNTGVATITSGGVVTGVASGTTLISYTLGGVCRTTSILTVNPAPAVPAITTQPGAFSCSGANYQNFGTNIAPAAGVSYAWSVDGATLVATGAGSQYSLINLNTPGMATIRLSATLGTTGCVRSDSVRITVNTEVAAFSSGIIYSGGELICTDNTYDSYRWGYDDVTTLDSTIIAGATTQDCYVPTLDLVHKYYWLMTTKAGCRQKSYYNAPATVVNAPSLADVTVQLYPNPASSLINVRLEGAPAATYTVMIYDMPGRLAAQQVFNGSNTAVAVDQLLPGTYTMVVLGEGQRIATKLFVKQ